MKGLFVKKFVTVVMDGSNDGVVNEIVRIVDMLTREYDGKITCHSLDSEHPTMKVIETYTSRKNCKIIQNLIEQSYPGLCVFNPAM